MSNTGLRVEINILYVIVGVLLFTVIGCGKDRDYKTLYENRVESYNSLSTRFQMQTEELNIFQETYEDAVELNNHGKLYAKVPFSKAFTEMLYNLVLTKPNKFPLPPTHKIAGKEVQLMLVNSNKAIKRKVGDGDWQGCKPYVLVEYDFGCQYDNNGSYFVPFDLYRKCKPYLIHEHKGRLEYFNFGPLKKKNGIVVFDLNPNDFELFVWDANDKVWRWPLTLEEASRGTKFKTGEFLYDQPTPDHKLKTGPIGELIQQAKEKGKIPAN